MNTAELNSRKGVIRINKNMLDLLTLEESIELFSKFFPKCMFPENSETIVMIGVSPLFEIVSNETYPPMYEAIFTRISIEYNKEKISITFNKINQ